MKTFLQLFIFLVLCLSNPLQAQILKDIRLGNNLPNRPGFHEELGELHIGDFNGDGQQDVIIPSNTSPLAFSNGTGFFSQDYTISIDDGGFCSSIGDLDGDGDLDLVTLYGFYADISSSKYLNIYLNDGQGNLSKDSSQSLQGLAFGDIEIADIDQDGDLDIFHTGVFFPGIMYSYFYINDGNGKFSQQTQEGLVAMCEGDVALEDLNGDGAPDLLFTGMTQRLTAEDTTIFSVPFYYLNDGNGFFIEQEDHNLPNAMYSCVGIVDIDLDNDNDLVLLSDDNANLRQAFLFLNDGNGSFSDSIELPVTIPLESHFEFGDIDNNGSIDMVLMGGSELSPNDGKVIRLLMNNGNYNFEVKSDHNIEGVYNPHFKLLDTDNNGTLDLVMPYDSGVYSNDGAGNFTMQSSWFRNLKGSLLKKVDINGDGFTDVIHMGLDHTGNTVANLHINDWTNTFSFKSVIFEGGTYPKTIEAIDLNQDNLPDLLAGCDGDQMRCFINEGEGSFTETEIDIFEQGSWTYINAEDFNEDGLVDLILSGIDINSNTASKVYKGLENGQFELVKTLDITIKSIKKLHVNNDDIIDFALTAKEDYFSNFDKLYISLGTQSWESFLDEIDYSYSGGMVFPTDYDYMQIADHSNEQHIILHYPNSNKLFIKDSENIFQNYGYFDHADESLIYTGDINMDGIGDYLRTEKNQNNEYYSIVNILGDDLISIDSITANQRQFLQVRNHLREDFDKDGDTDVLILQENGEVSYLENQSQHPEALLQPEEEKSFLLYPNPVSSSNLNVVLDEAWTEAKNYIIYDRLGRAINLGELQDQTDGPYQEIKLNQLSPGLYTILIYSKDRKSSQSFVVQQ